MPIPDFQQFLTPVLQITADGGIHTRPALVAKVEERFGITEEDKRELLPSGKQSRVVNRVQWAIQYLRRSGLLDNVSRGQYRISERGKTVLATGPAKIDVKFLRQFPEFLEFVEKRNDDDDDTDAPLARAASKETPTEQLESTYQALRRELAEDLLEKVQQCSPRYFEQIVVDLLVAMGYGGSHAEAGQKTRYTADGGVDGIIKEDKLGLDSIYLQAKRWEATVGRPVVQAFAGSLEGYRARKGVLITTSQFSSDAKEYVDRIEKKIVLIDGEQLAQLMIDHNVGVTVQNTYVLKRVDGDYFEEE
jgi:restriction system protein